MKQGKIVPFKQSLKEKRDQKHRAMVSIITRTLNYLSFMERMQVSDETPEMFLDSIYPIKEYFNILEPQLTNMRIKDLGLKAQLKKFFSMVTKEIDISKTMEAYLFLKSINY